MHEKQINPKYSSASMHMGAFVLYQTDKVKAFFPKDEYQSFFKVVLLYARTRFVSSVK